jgi:hypothetical protein
MQYQFAMSVKLSEAGVIPTKLKAIVPGAEDLILSSKKFDTLQAAVESCNGVLGDLTRALNEASTSRQFKLLSEVNPKHSGQPTISKDWGANEIAKVWVVDSNVDPAEGKAIHAFGLAQLIEVQQERTLN